VSTPATDSHPAMLGTVLEDTTAASCVGCGVTTFGRVLLAGARPVYNFFERRRRATICSRRLGRTGKP
jgi:hypothetical protein